MAKYVGALCWALHCAAGAVMIAQIAHAPPEHGAPISWLSRNPFSDGVWLFPTASSAFIRDISSS